MTGSSCGPPPCPGTRRTRSYLEYLTDFILQRVTADGRQLYGEFMLHGHGDWELTFIAADAGTTDVETATFNVTVPAPAQPAADE